MAKKGFWYDDDRKEEDYGLLRGLTHVKVENKYIAKDDMPSAPVSFHGEKKIHKVLVK
jgi:hypothetical protein